MDKLDTNYVEISLDELSNDININISIFFVSFILFFKFIN